MTVGLTCDISGSFEQELHADRQYGPVCSAESWTQHLRNFHPCRSGQSTVLEQSLSLVSTIYLFSELGCIYVRHAAANIATFLSAEREYFRSSISTATLKGRDVLFLVLWFPMPAFLLNLKQRV